MTFGGTTYGGTAYGSTAERDITDQPAPVPASGWHLVVTHPATGRRLRPDVLDEPAILPSLNSLPEIRIPVRKSDVWLDPSWENNPGNATLDVFLDGVKQPIDELNEIEDREDRTILVGVGATELRDRVSAEYRSERRHIAAQNLITNNTSYAEDVDTPSVESVTGETFQDPTTTAELQDDTDLPADNVIDISGDEVTAFQTSFTQEAEAFDNSSDASTETNSNASDGTNIQVGTADSQFYEWDFTLSHTLPADDFEVGVRWNETTNILADFTWYLNGHDISKTQISTYSPTNSNSGFEWQETIIATSGNSNLTGDLTAGTYTLRVEVNDSSGGTWQLDVVQPYDNGDRFGGFNYTYDNTLNANSGWLDGPGLHPDSVEVMGEDETSAFSITAADATLSINDTTGDQRLQVSNDRGSNWFPSDGTEDNTNTVDVTFGSSGSALRLRFDLAAYSPSGTRNQTPRENYDAQTVTDWTLNADIDLELLLINQNYDNSLVSILNDIAGNEFVWSANLDSNGNYQVSWTQPGARTASDDPDIGEVSIRKNIDTFDRITIRGSNKQITGETFSASTSFVDLNESFAVPGSETVYDDAAGTTFDLDSDYEMNWQNDPAQIRAIDGGDLDTSQSYSINYDIEVEGSYPSSVSNPDREFVDTIPGVVTDRGAEQIAFALFDGDAEDPRYEGDLSLPRPDVSFDPLDALTLDNLDLPSEATPLEVRGEPSISPSGLTLRLGSRPPIEQSLSSIAENVAAISKRT